MKGFRMTQELRIHIDEVNTHMMRNWSCLNGEQAATDFLCSHIKFEISHNANIEYNI